jgi:hypothetical protein
MVTDVGLWKLTITNTEGQSSSFDGSLYFAPDSPLANLSENLRNILDRPMLLGFDGAAEELLQFVSVHFEYGGKEYCYLGDDTRLSIGDKVEVPVGDHGKKAVATVVGVEYGTEKDAPFPADRIKRIISKKEPVVPEASGETPFDAVKAVIDDLDPEYLLADLAPDDEYDGESKHIANAITAEMTPQQIAEIMAKEFSRSFSDHYDTNYFMVAATRVKKALSDGGTETETPWRWCLVGNIVQSHEFGENGDIRVGTKHFAPGAKVYIAPAQWGDGYEKVCVIGKPRGKRPLIEIVMKLEYIENLRIKKVFDPAALMRMTESSYTWWNNTDADQQAILKVIESIRQ